MSLAAWSLKLEAQSCMRDMHDSETEFHGLFNPRNLFSGAVWIHLGPGDGPPSFVI